MNLIEKKIDMLFRKLAYKRGVSKNHEVPPFTGDKNNPVEVWEYNARYGIMPVKTIEHGDNVYTHIYEDGTSVTIQVHLISILTPYLDAIEEEKYVKKLQKVRKNEEI